nr:MAG TPA: hypothetical protein [Caudoviricetes sp.]
MSYLCEIAANIVYFPGLRHICAYDTLIPITLRRCFL